MGTKSEAGTGRNLATRLRLNPWPEAGCRFREPAGTKGGTSVPGIPPPKGGNRDQCGLFRSSQMKERHAPVVLEQLEGQDVAGGCEDCSAFQRVARDRDGIWVLTTFHDEGCPAYKTMKGEKS
jgi:hypothetical protein